MVSFIDAHREEYGVEPMCVVVPIAPSTYYENKAREADPTRARRDAGLRGENRRVWDAIRAISSTHPELVPFLPLNIAVFTETAIQFCLYSILRSMIGCFRKAVSRYNSAAGKAASARFSTRCAPALILDLIGIE